MTAYTTNQELPPSKVVRYPTLTLKSGQHVYRGSRVAIELSSGKLLKSVSGNTGIKDIGIATQEVDASSTGLNADSPCNVDVIRDIKCRYFKNDTSTPVTLVGVACYSLDDQTVTGNSSGNAACGICWGIDTMDGVLVEVTNITASVLTPSTTLDTASANFTGNDWAPAANTLVNGQTYVIGSGSNLGAAATLTLPSSGVSAGTTVTFAANGAQGNFTVGIRMGTTTITGATALTGSKRWIAKCINVGDATTSIWVVDWSIAA
jgi:hypothetical protein